VSLLAREEGLGEGSCLPCSKGVCASLLALEEEGPSVLACPGGGSWPEPPGRLLVVFQGRQGVCACLGVVDGMGLWPSGAWAGTRQKGGFCRR
jgi:hypothetical protein